MYFYYVEDIVQVKQIITNIIKYKIKHKKRNHKKQKLNSLQVQGYLRKHNSVVSSTSKSTFLSAPLIVTGSMTIEAAITIPLFLLIMIALIYFMLIINFQNFLYQNMTNTAKNISRYSYAIEKVGEILGQQTSSEIQTNTSQKLSDLSITEDLLKGGLTGIYAFNKILDRNVRELAKNLGIYGGLSGINMLESDLSKQEDVDLAIAYTVKIPMISSEIYKMSFINRCYFRNFIGKSIDIKSVKSKKTVYITKSGSVYHIYIDCTHIELSILSVPYSDVAFLRNKSGGKYKKCEKCVNKAVNEENYVIVTTDGDRYHVNKECSGIIRNVIAIDISQIESRTLCKRCAGKTK